MDLCYPNQRSWASASCFLYHSPSAGKLGVKQGTPGRDLKLSVCVICRLNQCQCLSRCQYAACTKGSEPGGSWRDKTQVLRFKTLENFTLFLYRAQGTKLPFWSHPVVHSTSRLPFQVCKQTCGTSASHFLLLIHREKHIISLLKT